MKKQNIFKEKHSEYNAVKEIKKEKKEKTGFFFFFQRLMRNFLEQ